MKEFGPEKCRDDVRFEGSDRHGSDIFETQLPIKFQPNPTTESKVMHSGSPCTIEHSAKDSIISQII